MRLPVHLLSAWLFVLFFAGCESRMDPKPAVLRATLSAADREALSPELRRVYDAILDGSIIDDQASEYRAALVEASDVQGSYTSESKRLTYVWYGLTPDRSAEYEMRGEPYYGPPYMWVRVQKKFGQIYECGVSTPSNW